MALLLACEATSEQPMIPPMPSDGGVLVDASPSRDADQLADATALDATSPADGAISLPLFSHPHGLYEREFALTLNPPAWAGPAHQILYTLDGRDPREHGASVYQGPIEIRTTTTVSVSVLRDGTDAIAPVTQTYIFPSHIPTQSAPSDYPSTWWNLHEGGPYEADYAMDPDITDSPVYRGQFPKTFRSIPIIALTLDPDDLFGPQGIHENTEEHGLEWERPGFAEMFDDSGAENFQIRCGIRIHGGSGRRAARAGKKSFRLLFKEEYGATKLNYPLYDDSPVRKFDTLVLRGRYNRSWSHYEAGQRTRAQYVRERFVADTLRAMGQPAPRARHTHLFLNGLYWGIYLIQERPDHSFQAQYLGGDKSEYDAIHTGEVLSGDLEAWNRLIDMVEAGVAETAAYESVQTLIDIDNFIDYMLVNIYLGNIDWPDRNWYVGRARTETGRFRFFPWDSELTIRNLNDDLTEVDYPRTPGRIYRQLRENEAFRARFAERIQLHLFDGGALSPAALIDRWQSIADGVEPAIFAESARWGDYWRDVRMDASGELYTHEDHWLVERARVSEQYLPFRRDIVLEQFQSAGLYPSIDPPVSAGAQTPAAPGRRAPPSTDESSIDGRDH